METLQEQSISVLDKYFRITKYEYPKECREREEVINETERLNVCMTELEAEVNTELVRVTGMNMDQAYETMNSKGTLAILEIEAAYRDEGFLKIFRKYTEVCKEMFFLQIFLYKSTRESMTKVVEVCDEVLKELGKDNPLVPGVERTRESIYPKLLTAIENEEGASEDYEEILRVIKLRYGEEASISIN